MTRRTVSLACAAQVLTFLPPATIIYAVLFHLLLEELVQEMWSTRFAGPMAFAYQPLVLTLTSDVYPYLVEMVCVPLRLEIKASSLTQRRAVLTTARLLVATMLTILSALVPESVSYHLHSIRSLDVC